MYYELCIIYYNNILSIENSAPQIEIHDPPQSPIYTPFHTSTPEPTEEALSSDTVSLSSSPSSDYCTYTDIAEQLLDSQSIGEVTFDMSEQFFAEKSLNETTVTIEPEAEETCTVVKSINAGYKLVFDNIDKTLKPRFMTQDSQTTILHYVQAYAVKDRIDYSSIGDEQNNETNLYKILPDSEDYHLLKERFVIHVSRIISTYLGFFKDDFKNLVQRHIPHRYSSEMCHKSEIVSIYYLLLIPLL